MLVEAGVKADLIFSGTANTVNTTYNLTKIISTYSFLLVAIGVKETASAARSYTERKLYPVATTITDETPIYFMNSAAIAYTITGSTIRITEKTLNKWSDIFVYEIYGIY